MTAITMEREAMRVFEGKSKTPADVQMQGVAMLPAQPTTLTLVPTALLDIPTTPSTTLPTRTTTPPTYQPHTALKPCHKSPYTSPKAPIEASSSPSLLDHDPDHISMTVDTDTFPDMKSLYSSLKYFTPPSGAVIPNKPTDIYMIWKHYEGATVPPTSTTTANIQSLESRLAIQLQQGMSLRAIFFRHHVEWFTTHCIVCAMKDRVIEPGHQAALCPKGYRYMNYLCGTRPTVQHIACYVCFLPYPFEVHRDACDHDTKISAYPDVLEVLAGMMWDNKEFLAKHGFEYPSDELVYRQWLVQPSQLDPKFLWLHLIFETFIWSLYQDPSYSTT
ncbi:hypothetical protein FRB99_006337 [Tulasnella sp. 403]|nr:hypothetical protein FRB99_006337 [Tulasnella sp. 403]